MVPLRSIRRLLWLYIYRTDVFNATTPQSASTRHDLQGRKEGRKEGKKKGRKDGRMKGSKEVRALKGKVHLEGVGIRPRN